MSGSGRAIRTGIFVLLVGMLILMPYSTFLLQVVRHLFSHAGHPLPGSIIRATVGWKEIVALIGVVLFTLLWAVERSFPFRISRLDIYMLVFIGFGVIVGGAIAGKVGRVVFGFRYDFSPFLYYFLARSVVVSRDQIVGLLKSIALLAIPICIFGLLQTAYLPFNFMERFGYSWGPSPTGNPLPPYHMVADSIVRAMSTFPGPNSLAMYAVLIFLAVVLLGRKWFGKTLFGTLAVLTFLVLVATFSRGHLVSLILALGCLFFFVRLKNLESAVGIRRAGGLAVGGIMLVLLLSLGISLGSGLIKQGQIKSGLISMVLHQESSEIHRDVRIQAWESIKTHPFGTGLGTSGLATTNTGEPIFNPESWYFQITQELGWAGLLLGLGLIAMIARTLVTLLRDLSDNDDRALLFFVFAEFVAVVVSANFLPSWFEVGSLTWWIIFGFFLTDYFESFPRSRELAAIHTID